MHAKAIISLPVVPIMQKNVNIMKQTDDADDVVLIDIKLGNVQNGKRTMIIIIMIKNKQLIIYKNNNHQILFQPMYQINQIKIKINKIQNKKHILNSNLSIMEKRN